MGKHNSRMVYTIVILTSLLHYYSNLYATMWYIPISQLLKFAQTSRFSQAQSHIIVKARTMEHITRHCDVCGINNYLSDVFIPDLQHSG